MEQQEFLIDLEDTISRFTWGLNALELMVLGLGQAGAPYTGGFQAVWLYLRETEEEVQNLVKGVSAARTTA